MVLVMWVNSFSQVPTSRLSQGRRGTHSPCHVWEVGEGRNGKPGCRISQKPAVPFSAVAATQGEHLPCPPQLRTSIMSKCPLAAQMPGDAHC